LTGRTLQQAGARRPANDPGLRTTVYDVLEYLGAGMSEEQILADFPYLTKEDILACLKFAASRERAMVAVQP
jgi:uncharacterized protein (DUF433 family)